MSLGISRTALFLLLVALFALDAPAAEQVVVDFEDAPIYAHDDVPNRFEQWTEKDVVFTLANAPVTTKGKGLMMFFPHPTSGHKGLVCAMATEPIPVRATFPAPVSSVTVTLWGSTRVPVLVEAFDTAGKVVDRAELKEAPSRQSPGDPIPVFEMTVTAERIAYVQFSGPRESEFLAADEIRFVPSEATHAGR
jgi:hypothetical protein